jgi:hypothetical protein
MATEDSREGRSEGPSVVHRLTLELDICESEPLTGQVGPAGAPARIAFQGWIDLMSAIRTLCEHPASRPSGDNTPGQAPGIRAG